MHDWVVKLLALQEKDVRISQLEEQLATVPGEKKRAAELVKQAEVDAAAARSAVTESEKAIHTDEKDIDSIRTRMRDFQAKSTMNNNNEEYKEALHQIETCRSRIRELEDQQLVLMESLESRSRDLQDRRRLLAAAKQRADEMIADFDTRARNCAAELEAARAERAAREVISLPIYPELTEDQQRRVVSAVAEFYGVG